MIIVRACSGKQYRLLTSIWSRGVTSVYKTQVIIW